MRRRRDELAALCVLEAGKPLAEADADVCEAIDFCEYYGRRAIELGAGAPLLQPPGEANEYRYQPRGVGVVIAPWNFPLAIPTGMVTAALVTGNTVVFKPAEQTPGIASRLVEILFEAGLPPGALAFLPGVGEEIGPALVEHPDVAFVTFTGSKAVGLDIIRRAAEVRPGQRHVKRVVAEMGGKNAIIVDADADLDDAVPAILLERVRLRGPEVFRRVPRHRSRRRLRRAGRAAHRCGRTGADRTPPRSGNRGRPADRHRRTRAGAARTRSWLRPRAACSCSAPTGPSPAGTRGRPSSR